MVSQYPYSLHAQCVQYTLNHHTVNLATSKTLEIVICTGYRICKKGGDGMEEEGEKRGGI